MRPPPIGWLVGTVPSMTAETLNKPQVAVVPLTPAVHDLALKLHDHPLDHSCLNDSTVQEGMGAIRHVLIERAQPLYRAEFALLGRAFRNAQSVTTLLANAPRYLVEGMSLVLIAAVAIARQPGASPRASNADLTVIIVAHCLSTLRHCSRTVQLHARRMIAAGSFAEVIGSEVETHRLRASTA